MFVLINREKMDLIAKHPNFATLCGLGVILCPDEQEVVPLDLTMFKDYETAELAMLYVAVTLDIPDSNWSRDELEYILLYLINELPETVLNNRQVEDQADYAIKWGIEGYCSFLKGKSEPCMEEGKWENLTLDFDTVRAAMLIAIRNPIVFKIPVQKDFEKQRERSIES